METIRVRGSATDRALACAGSISEPEFPINDNSPEAIAGTAAHEACESIPHGDEPEIEAIAARHDVDPGDLEMLAAFGRQAWDKIKLQFPQPQTEVRLSGEVTRGTTDILSITPDAIAVGDWKSGHSMDEHPGQLLSYAASAVDQYYAPKSGYVLGVEIWLRAREYRVHKFTLEQISAFKARLADQIANAGSQYSVGTHCKFCPHTATCGARVGYIRKSCEALAEVDPEGLVDRDLLGSLWERSRVVKSALTAYERLIDAALKNGPLDVGNGARLETKTSQVDILDPVAVQPMLAEAGLSEGQIADCLKISKTSIMSAVRENLPKKPARGAVGRAKGDLLRAMHDAGAITRRNRTTKGIVRD